MKKITYNLASQPRLNWPRFAAILAALLLTAGILGFLGIRTLSTLHRRTLEQQTQHRDEIRRDQEFERKQKELEKLIQEKKKNWQSKIDFSNSLIDRKSFSFCDRLTFLERILPPEIQVEKVSLWNGSDAITCSLIAPSSPLVDQTYRRLGPYHLQLVSEFQKNGLYTLNVALRYADKKK